ncbi:MAG: hypothetical protein ACYC6A_24220 [Armatimonadota bacterium]
MRSWIMSLFLLILLIIPWIGRAEEGFTRAVTDAQLPAPVRAMELDAGYRLGLDAGDTSGNSGYLRLAYYGIPVKQEGVPLKYAGHIDLAAPVIPEGLGDRYQLALIYERGATQQAGSLISSEAVLPLPWQYLRTMNLRGVAYVAGNLDTDEWIYAAGVESPPIRIPIVGGAGWSNWAVIGIQAEHLDREAVQTTAGVATYRAFLGKGFGWRKSADVGKTAAAIEKTIIDQAPTYEQARALAGEIKAIPAIQRSALQQLFLDAVIEAEIASNWTPTVTAMARGHADAISDQATIAAYGELSGWQPIGDGAGGQLVTATVDWWLVPGRDDLFLRVRYERGDDRASGENLNQVLLATSLRF